MKYGYSNIELYKEDGWPDIDMLASSGAMLIVLIGARRIGKTYGVLSKYMREHKRILYMRMTKTQLDRCVSGDNNPFIPPANELGIDTSFEISGKDTYLCREVKQRDEKGTPIEYGDTIAQGTSVFATRGIASGQYQAIVFDEFIPERGAVVRKDAGYNLKSAIQSVTDINTMDLQCWLLANSNNLDSDVLNEFGLITVYEEMRLNGSNVWLSEDGAILCVDFKKSPISDELKKTKLGRILNTGAYGDMAFDNDWSNNNFLNVKRLTGQAVREYVDVISIGDIMIMGHKTAPRYYVRACPNPPNGVVHWEATPDVGRKCADRLAPLLYATYGANVYYDSFNTKRKYNDYILGGRYKL